MEVSFLLILVILESGKVKKADGAVTRMDAVKAHKSAAAVEAGVEVTAVVAVVPYVDVREVSAKNGIRIRFGIDQVEGAKIILLGIIVP